MNLHLAGEVCIVNVCGSYFGRVELNLGTVFMFLVFLFSLVEHLHRKRGNDALEFGRLDE